MKNESRPLCSLTVFIPHLYLPPVVDPLHVPLMLGLLLPGLADRGGALEHDGAGPGVD